MATRKVYLVVKGQAFEGCSVCAVFGNRQAARTYAGGVMALSKGPWKQTGKDEWAYGSVYVNVQKERVFDTDAVQ